MSRPISILVNPAVCSQPNGAFAEHLRELFAANGAEVSLIEPCDGAPFSQYVQRALDGGAETIVAVGGDGTVNCVAGVLVGTDARLGVLPCGTLNHFAKDLGLPLDLEAAVKTIVAGRVRRIDVGEVNGRIFVNNSSIGLYPTMVHHREQQERLGKRKGSAFVRACLTALGRYPLIHVTIEADGRRVTRKTPLVFVGNNDYHLSGLKIGTRDRLDSGLLSIYLTPDVGRLGLVWFALRALVGHLRSDRDLVALQSRAATINGRSRRLRVAADGEIDQMETPLEYRILPRVLQVVVPPEAMPQPRS